MGLSGKHQGDGMLESEGKRWVIAGIPLRAPLKPIYTNPPPPPVQKELDSGDDNDYCDEECSATTPTSEEARIPNIMTCPPAPRKRKPSSKCNYSRSREFFITPPDLETVFIRRHVERAN